MDRETYKIERNWCKENCDKWDPHRYRERMGQIRACLVRDF